MIKLRISVGTMRVRGNENFSRTGYSNSHGSNTKVRLLALVLPLTLALAVPLTGVTTTLNGVTTTLTDVTTTLSSTLKVGRVTGRRRTLRLN